MTPVHTTATVASFGTARSIQSLSPTRMPWKSAPTDACRKPRSPNQTLCEIATKKSSVDYGESECPATRHEHEEGSRQDASREHCRVDRVEQERAVGTPDRQQRECVRDRARVDEPLERDRKREERTRDGHGGRHPARARQPSVDPDEKRDQEERRHDERVPLLDPVRELRRERGDDEKQRDRQRGARGEEGSQRGRRTPGDHGEQHEAPRTGRTPRYRSSSARW